MTKKIILPVTGEDMRMSDAIAAIRALHVILRTLELAEDRGQSDAQQRSAVWAAVLEAQLKFETWVKAAEEGRI